MHRVTITYIGYTVRSRFSRVVIVHSNKQCSALPVQVCGIHKLVVIAGGVGEGGGVGVGGGGGEAESMYDRRGAHWPPAPPGEPV